MKMNNRNQLSALVLAVAAALGAGSLVTSQVTFAAEQKNAVSKAMVKPLSDAQKALQAKKYDEALAKLSEAETVPGQTPYDTFVLHQLRAAAYGQSGRQNEALPSYVAEVESGFMEPAEAERMARGVTALYYQNKDYAHAAEFGQKTIAAGQGNADTWFLVAHSLSLQGKDAEATKVLKDYLADAAKKGEKPSENSLILLTQISARAKDNKGVIDTLQLMVENYPKPETWRDLLMMLRDGGGRGPGSDAYTFNIYRMMRETGTLKEGNDFLEMAQLGIQLGSPGEASDALRRGTTANAYSAESDKAAAKKLQQTAQTLEDADRAGLAKFETEAKAAKSGEGDVRLGQTLLSYDQPDKALEAIQRGIGKGSLRNADEAQILLGIAYLRLGRKADAATAFGAAKGGDARFGNLAHLWAVYARG